MVTVDTSGWWDYECFCLFVFLFVLFKHSLQQAFIDYYVSCVVLSERLRAENEADLALAQLYLPNRSAFIYLTISVKSFYHEINMVSIINQNELKNYSGCFFCVFGRGGFLVVFPTSTIWRLFHDSVNNLNCTQEISAIGLMWIS